MHFVILSQILKNIQNSRGKNDSRKTVPQLFENEQSSSMPWSSYSSYFLPIQCPAPRVPSRRLFRGRVLLSSPGFHQIDPMVSLFRFSSTFSSWWGSRWQTPVWVLNIILLLLVLRVVTYVPSPGMPWFSGLVFLSASYSIFKSHSNTGIAFSAVQYLPSLSTTTNKVVRKVKSKNDSFFENFWVPQLIALWQTVN